MTRLNQVPAHRRQLQAEAALDALIGKKAEIDEMLSRLQALSDDHLNAHPAEIDWGDVGTLGHYAELLKRIRARTPGSQTARRSWRSRRQHQSESPLRAGKGP